MTGPHDPFEARPTAVHLHEAARLPRDFDIAFVAMKVYDTAWATQLACRHLGPDGFVVSSQNCWPDLIVAGVAGGGRAVGLVMSKIGVALWKPGQVERGMEKGQGRGHDVFRVGEHDGQITPRAQALAEMLSIIDGSQVTDNLWGERWAKLSANAMGNPVQAMSGLGSLEIASSEVGRAITIHLAAESARVGLSVQGAEVQRRARRAVGRRRPPRDLGDARPDAHARVRRHARTWRASMAQDVTKGRTTEIDYMNGHVVAQGRERGVATPVSAAVVDVIHEWRRPAPRRPPRPSGWSCAARGSSHVQGARRDPGARPGVRLAGPAGRPRARCPGPSTSRWLRAGSTRPRPKASRRS